jgi:5-methylcytosine-specific restriction endonuclease McrA
MIGSLPTYLEAVDPHFRSFPASWRDAAIRELFDDLIGGIICPGCKGLFRYRAGLRKLQADHIFPFSRGGLTTWENLQLLCGACNLKKLASVEPV